MMQKQSFKSSSGSRGWQMGRMIRSFSAVIFLALAALGASCSEPEEYPIVGSWVIAEAGTDFGYFASWLIRSDKTFKLDYDSIGFDGQVSGYTSGTYRTLSDSIMVVHSKMHENLEANELFRRTVDTLFIEVNGSELIASQAKLIDSNQYRRFDIILTWERQ